MFYFRSGLQLNSLGKPSDGFPQGGCNVSVIIQFHTYYLSNTEFTSPFPHLFSIFRENKCLVRSGYEFVTILHFGSRLVLDQSGCVRAQWYTIFRDIHTEAIDQNPQYSQADYLGRCFRLSRVHLVRLWFFSHVGCSLDQDHQVNICHANGSGVTLRFSGVTSWRILGQVVCVHEHLGSRARSTISSPRARSEYLEGPQHVR